MTATRTRTRTLATVFLVVVNDWHGVMVWPFSEAQTATAAAREIAAQRAEEGFTPVQREVPGTLLVLNFSADGDDTVWVEEALVDPPPGDTRCDCGG